MNVGRQWPRNIRIISPVSLAAMRPPITAPLSAALTKTDWSNRALINTPLKRLSKCHYKDFAFHVEKTEPRSVSACWYEELAAPFGQSTASTLRD
jgi:hypothetical protein